MNNYLGRLAAINFHRSEAIKPRLPSLFETAEGPILHPTETTETSVKRAPEKTEITAKEPIESAGEVEQDRRDLANERQKTLSAKKTPAPKDMTSPELTRSELDTAPASVVSAGKSDSQPLTPLTESQSAPTVPAAPGIAAPRAELVHEATLGQGEPASSRETAPSLFTPQVSRSNSADNGPSGRAESSNSDNRSAPVIDSSQAEQLAEDDHEINEVSRHSVRESPDPPARGTAFVEPTIKLSMETPKPLARDAQETNDLPPTVEVTIGRIEVRAVPERPAKAPSQRRQTPKIPLEQYLSSSKGERR